MPNPTTIADIEARYQTLTAQQTTNANAYLTDAWELLLSRRPNLEADMTAGTVRTGNVRRVVAAIVIRILKNPDGKKSEGVDDYQYTRHELLASGLLHVMPDELADITPGRKRRRSVRLVAHGES